MENAGVSSLPLGRAGSTLQARNPSDGTSEEPESVLRHLSHRTREGVSEESMREEGKGVEERGEGLPASEYNTRSHLKG